MERDVSEADPHLSFWSTSPQVHQQISKSSHGVMSQNHLDTIYPHYDMRNPRLVYEDEVFVPMTVSSRSKWRTKFKWQI